MFNKVMKGLHKNMQSNDDDLAKSSAESIVYIRKGKRVSYLQLLNNILKQTDGKEKKYSKKGSKISKRKDRSSKDNEGKGKGAKEDPERNRGREIGPIK